jgi:hypothetical protein
MTITVEMFNNILSIVPVLQIVFLTVLWQKLVSKEKLIFSSNFIICLLLTTLNIKLFKQNISLTYGLLLYQISFTAAILATASVKRPFDLLASLKQALSFLISISLIPLSMLVYIVISNQLHLPSNSIASYIALALFTVIISTQFSTINKKISKLLQKLISFQYTLRQNKLNNFKKRIKNKNELPFIFEEIVDQCVNIFNLQNASYYLHYDLHYSRYILQHSSQGNKPKSIIKANDPILNHILDIKTIISKNEIIAAMDVGIQNTHQLLKFFEENQFSLAAPIKIKNTIQGILFLGKKISNEPFSESDITLITSFIAEISTQKRLVFSKNSIKPGLLKIKKTSTSNKKTKQKKSKSLLKSSKTEAPQKT